MNESKDTDLNVFTGKEMRNKFGSKINITNFVTDVNINVDDKVAKDEDLYYLCGNNQSLINKVMDMDFGFGAGSSNDPIVSANGNKEESPVTDLGSGKVTSSTTTEPIVEVNDNTESTNKVEEPSSKGNENNGVEVSLNERIEEGTTIEVGDDVYTADSNGNLIDKDGKVFKKSDEVKAWLEQMEVEDDSDKDVLSINSIQKLVGFEVTDENNKPVEFENTSAGVKAYLDAVIENKRNEHYETAINTLYQKYPILNDVLNYYVANGNSLEGFGQMPDRSNITIDQNNVEQQKEIIRTAWKETNRKGDVESYINYLDASGILYATAKDELAGLQESDANARKELELKAEKAEKENIERIQNYWNGVNEVIKTRQIAGYQIPENIIISRNGQKISVTPNDFFNYLYRVDNEGHSAYERDLMKQTPESRRDDEILRAYLTFVGGNYSNLVDMAINKQNVERLKLKAREKKTTTTVRINRPTNNGENKIDFGY